MTNYTLIITSCTLFEKYVKTTIGKNISVIIPDDKQEIFGIPLEEFKNEQTYPFIIGYCVGDNKSWNLL